MAAEFDTVAEWTAEVAADLGTAYYIPAGCRGSGSPAALDWLVGNLDPAPGEAFLDCGAGVGGPAAYAVQQRAVRPVLVEPEAGACRAARDLFGYPVLRAVASALPIADESFERCLVVGRALHDARSTVTPDRDGSGRTPVGTHRNAGVRGAGTGAGRQPKGNNFPTVDFLQNLVERAGLRIEAWRSTADLPPGSAGLGTSRRYRRQRVAGPALREAGVANGRTASSTDRAVVGQVGSDRRAAGVAAALSSAGQPATARSHRGRHCVNRRNAWTAPGETGAVSLPHATCWSGPSEVEIARTADAVGLARRCRGKPAASRRPGEAVPRSPAPHAVQVKENGMGMRGPTSSRSCSTVEQPIRADWPESLFLRSGQPAALPAAVNPPCSPRDQVSLTLSALPPGSARPRSDRSSGRISFTVGSGRHGCPTNELSVVAR